MLGGFARTSSLASSKVNVFSFSTCRVHNIDGKNIEVLEVRDDGSQLSRCFSGEKVQWGTHNLRHCRSTYGSHKLTAVNRCTIG